jgi:hypothetical protein
MAKSKVNTSDLDAMGVEMTPMINDSVLRDVSEKTKELQERDRESEAKIARLPEKERPKDFTSKSQSVKVRVGNDEPHQDYDKNKLHPIVKAKMEDGMQWVTGKFLSIEDNKKIKNPVTFEISRWGVTEQHTLIHNMQFTVRKFVADHLNSLTYMVMDDEIKQVSADSRFGGKGLNFDQSVAGHYPKYSFNWTYAEGSNKVSMHTPTRLVGI